MNLKKMNLTTIAALVLVSGAGGGILTNAATAVVSYGALADSIAAAEKSCATTDRNACKVAVGSAAFHFQALDESAKGAYQEAVRKRAGSAGGAR